MDMRKVLLQDLTPEMKLARTVFNPDGRVLVAAGTAVTPKVVARLAEKGLPAVYVSTPTSPLVEDIISEKTIAMLLKPFYEIYQSIKAGRGLEWRGVKEPLNALVDEALSHRRNLVGWTDIRIHDAYLFGHSINVTVLSVLMGIMYGYNEIKLRELAIGALFHDLGMLLIPQAILEKRSALNAAEERQMREHANLGFQLLRGRDDISAVSANIAYQHHERLDKSGYPRNLSDEGILEMSKIVAVADVYDAMTSERVYRRALSPRQAVNYLRSNAGRLFDPLAVAVLVKCVAEYPVGTRVRLSNGQIAVVSRVNPEDGRRPCVTVGGGHEINLLDRTELAIVEEVEEIRYNGASGE